MSQDRDDIGIDARLRRALASAPDAQIEPPSALDDAILRAAHAAVPKPAAVSASRGSQGFFASLRRAWSHPAAAPVFAVLALSTVIVSMWTQHGVPSPKSDDDVSRAAARAPLEVAKVPPPTMVGGADAAVPTAAPEPPAVPSAAAPQTDALSERIAESNRSVPEKRESARAEAKAVTRAPAATTSPAPSQTRRESPALEALADKASDTRPPPKEAAPRARQQEATLRRDAERDAPMTKAEGSREAAAVASAPPPSEPPPLSAIRSTEEARAPAPAPRGPSTPPADAAATGSVAANVAPPALMAPSRDGAFDVRSAAADAPPLARALDAAASWQWRSDPSQPPAAIDDRARAWLAQLGAAAHGRWVRVDEQAKAQRPASRAVRTVELWRDQAPWATIVIGPSDVTWFDAAGRAWRAVVPAEALAALRDR